MKTRMKTSLAKLKIKQIFDESINDIRNNKRPNISRKMLAKGYSPSSAKTLEIVKSKTWQQLLAQIQDEPLLDKLEEISMSDDKRSSISAIQEIFKLKDRYPKGESKVLNLFQKIEMLVESPIEESQRLEEEKLNSIKVYSNMFPDKR